MINLQFITHQTEKYSYLDSARMALEGGCKWIQLRMKEAPLEEVEAVALQLQQMCREYESILILDDHVELAIKLEVDGVHLGKMDMPVAEARQRMGEQFIIGGTAITGGKGGYIGTIAGAVIMTILDDFLTIVNIPEAGRQIMQGVIIVLLVLIYSREKHKK